MHEIRFHGRGGQGTVVASIVLAKAFFSAGYYVQTFPVFGIERRGAPVEAYLRLNRKKILVRSNIYAPDYVVVQDIKLIAHVDVCSGLKPGGFVLINSPDLPANLKPFSGYRLATVDATRLAVNNNLGTRSQPMINTAMIGAFARVMNLPPLAMVAAAIEQEITIKTQQNLRAAQEAYENVRLFGIIDGN